MVLGASGFYAVETKTLSLPAIGSAKIKPTEDGLVIDGRPATVDHPNQAERQARWLHEKLEEITGKNWPVKGVLLFPGWFVEPNKTARYSQLWILNPKAFKKYVLNGRERISHSDVQLASSSLTRSIRHESSMG